MFMDWYSLYSNNKMQMTHKWELYFFFACLHLVSISHFRFTWKRLINMSDINVSRRDAVLKVWRRKPSIMSSLNMLLWKLYHFTALCANTEVSAGVICWIMLTNGHPTRDYQAARRNMMLTVCANQILHIKSHGAVQMKTMLILLWWASCSYASTCISKQTVSIDIKSILLTDTLLKHIF